VSSSPTETLTEVVMPQMGVSVAEGTVLEWRKRPGDWVDADETICDVTTDKIDVEIPSPCSGRVASVLVEPGTTVSVGTPIASIDAGASPGEAHPDESSNGVAAEPPAEASAQEADRSKVFSPVVRRMADEHGVDLNEVSGTGVGGRVRKRDVVAFLETGEQEPRARPLHTESPYRPDEPAPAVPAATNGGRREAMTPMRSAIAKHMVDSLRTSAQCTTIAEVNMGAVSAARAALREGAERRGVKLTHMAFVAAAVVEALGRFPILNSSIEGEEIVHHDAIHLGIAVALDDGLVVPVIRDAQRLNLEGLAAGIQDVAGRARDKRLEPDDVAGGTFTITNPGQFGAIAATPIINQPQTGILDLEAIVKRPVVIETAEGDAIAIRPMTNLCLSWDHRALDGAVAARFLADVKARLEEWEVRGS